MELPLAAAPADTTTAAAVVAAPPAPVDTTAVAIAAAAALAAVPVPEGPVWEKLAALSEAFPAQRSAEWLRVRKNLITGSEVSKIRTPGSQIRKSVMFQKLGVDPRPFEGNEYTAHGTLYEPEAAAAYAQAMGARLGSLNMIPHRDLPYVAFSPDGWAQYPSGEGRLIEIKCPAKRDLAATVPTYYVPQVQLGLHILWSHGIDAKCDFIQYQPAIPGVRWAPILKVITVERDPQWWADWAPRMASFWVEVEDWRAKGVTQHPDHDYYVRTGYFPRIPAAVAAEWWGIGSRAPAPPAVDEDVEGEPVETTTWIGL